MIESKDKAPTDDLGRPIVAWTPGVPGDEQLSATAMRLKTDDLSYATTLAKGE